MEINDKLLQRMRDYDVGNPIRDLYEDIAKEVASITQSRCNELELFKISLDYDYIYSPDYDYIYSPDICRGATIRMFDLPIEGDAIAIKWHMVDDYSFDPIAL